VLMTINPIVFTFVFVLGALLCFVELNVLTSATLSAVFRFIARFFPPKPYFVSFEK
jgi:hypothetical protein